MPWAVFDGAELAWECEETGLVLRREEWRARARKRLESVRTEWDLLWNKGEHVFAWVNVGMVRPGWLGEVEWALERVRKQL